LEDKFNVKGSTGIGAAADLRDVVLGLGVIVEGEDLNTGAAGVDYFQSQAVSAKFIRLK
jgi:hypothetical protein